MVLFHVSYSRAGSLGYVLLAMIEAGGAKPNYTSIIAANILLTKISHMAQSKVKRDDVHSAHHEIVGKVCITMEQRIGDNISITSLYIPFLDNTHPQSLKYHAFAKDSLTYIPVHSCPLSSKHP